MHALDLWISGSLDRGLSVFAKGEQDIRVCLQGR